MQPTTVSQASIVETPSIRFSYQTPDNSNTTTNVTLLKTEDSTQTEYHKSLSKPELNRVSKMFYA